MNLRRFIAPAVALVVLSGVAALAYSTRDSWVGYVFPDTNQPVEDDHHAEEEAHEEDEVHLSDTARENLKLEVAQVTAGPYSRELIIPGIVVERPGETDRAVTTRLGGVVTAVSAKPGDRVKAGHVLFTIEPTGDVLRTQVELAKAVKDLAVLTSTRDGVAQQVADKTRPANDLVEPQKQVALAANQIEGLRGQLRAWKLTEEQIERASRGDFVSEVEVTAPNEPSGPRSVAVTQEELDVHELKVRLGDTVLPGQTLCVLGSHRRLFVEGHAFASEAAVLAELMESGEGVKVEFAGEESVSQADLPKLPIERLSHVIDPTSRTFDIFLPLDNKPGTSDEGHHVWRYRPGQRVRLHLPVEKMGDRVVELPLGAVVREGAEAFVFEQHGDHFHRVPVRVLHETRTHVMIHADDVSPKAMLVQNQANALNRTMKAGEEHGHDHHHDHDH